MTALLERVSMLDAALRYADLGYRVLPCRPGDKRPLTEHGCKDASTDPEQIEKWWSAHPTANIGLSTEQLVVIDVDVSDDRPNDWPNDPERAESLCRCPFQTTPRGGRHFIFRQPDGAHWRNSAGKLAPNVDVRADGGYIVVSPSAVAGTRYEWRDDLVPRDQLPVPPGWLADELDRIGQPKTAERIPSADDGPILEGQRNDRLFKMGNVIAKTGAAFPEVLAAVKSANDRLCKPPMTESEIQDIAKRCVEYHAGTNGKKPKASSAGGGPMALAAAYLDEHFTRDGCRTLRWWRDEFFRWESKRHHYTTLPKSELQAVVFEWLGKRQPGAKPRDASDVIGALAALCRVPFSVEAPAYLGEADSVSARNVVCFANGIIDPTATDATLRPHSPEWFSLSSLPFPYAPAATCPKWDAFLREVLSDDPERVELLGRWFGLMLTSDTSFQKLLMLVGPKRSGKGTILRILQHIVGQDACVAPTLGSLAGEFGLSQLLHKSLAVFPDAHLSYRTDSIRILEALKSVVGEDSQSVNRKNREFLTNVRLRVRFILTVNQLPRFSDPSDALGSRLLILPFQNTYAGREDRTLERKLKSESAGILNWALRGLERLRAHGAFNTPQASEAIRANYRRLTAPVTGFIEDRCRLSPEASVRCSDLFAAYRDWCEKNGLSPAADTTFGGQLRAAEPSIERRRPRTDIGRAWCYYGIDLE